MKHIWIISWIGVTLLLCLMPSEWISGIEGTLVPGSRDAVGWQNLKEPLGHGILMAGVAFGLCRLFCIRKGPVISVGLSFLFVLLMASLIEWGQFLLPASFSRGFAWDDIVASAVGGAIGSVLACKVHRKLKNGATESGQNDLVAK